MGLCLGCKQQRDYLVGSGMVPSRFGDKYNLAGGNCNVLAMFFFLACDIWWLSVGPCSGCEQQRDYLVGSGMVPSRFGDKYNLAGVIVTDLPCDLVA